MYFLLDSEIQIILIEDNKVDLFLFQKVLEELKLEDCLTHFKYGPSFLEALERGELSLSSRKILFVDYNLPYQNGWEIIETLIDSPAFEGTYFVLMSNLLPFHITELCLRYPRLSCLEKHFEVEKFANDISTLLKEVF